MTFPTPDRRQRVNNTQLPSSAEISDLISQCKNRIQQYIEREEYVKADSAHKELAQLEKQKLECEYREKINQEKEKLIQIHEEHRQRRAEFIDHWKQEEEQFEQHSAEELENFIVCIHSVFLLFYICLPL